jgi:glycogen debranching enzyme
LGTRNAEDRVGFLHSGILCRLAALNAGAGRSESFALLDAGGDILESPLEALGFFHCDTRYLSRFELKIAGEAPYLLNSYMSDDNAQLRVNLANPDLEVHGGAIVLARNSIQIERSWVLDRALMFHRVTVRSYAPAPVILTIRSGPL